MPDGLPHDPALFARLAAALRFLQGEAAMHDEAEDIYQTLPRTHQTQINATNASAELNVTHALARTRQEYREDRRARVLAAVQALEAVLTDEPANTRSQFDPSDVQLIIDFVDAVTMLAPRSKRELIHFFDALHANDSGTMVAVTFPGHSRRQKLEVRFAHDLPNDLKETLGMPRSYGTPTG